jgi:hypothetical protein
VRKKPVENPPKQNPTRPTQKPKPITEGYDPDKRREK